MRQTTNKDHLNDLVHASLKTDPLSIAEEVTGKSYKEDEDTSNLGMLLHFDHVKQKRALLQMTKDLSHCCEFPYFLEFMKSMGFEKVLEDDFIDPFYPDNPSEEVCQVWWDDKRGILCYAESHGKNLNQATFYGNCKIEEYGYTSSGGLRGDADVTARSDAANKVWSATALLANFKRDDYDNISNERVAEKLGITVEEVQSAKENSPKTNEFWWVGSWHHEAIRHNLEAIDEKGEWKREWVGRPFLWLVNYTEVKVEGYDHDAITEERISRLPQHIQDCITPKEEA